MDDRERRTRRDEFEGALIKALRDVTMIPQHDDNKHYVKMPEFETTKQKETVHHER